MTGPLALHGGGEFHPGHEPFLRALLDAADAAARERTASGTPARTAAGAVTDAGEDGSHGRAHRRKAPGPIVRRVVIVPTAAGGERRGDGPRAVDLDPAWWGGRAWQVVGEGHVHWSPPGERIVCSYAAGATLVLPE